MLRIRIAHEPADFDTGRRLFQEYAQSLGIDLCFQNFEAELADLERQYGPPAGCLLLVEQDRQALGCCGVRLWENDIAELKRMYLKPELRGQGLGATLLMRALEQAGALGYKRIRLDTLPSMQAAIHIYRRFGFTDIPAYRENPAEGVLYLEKNLSTPAISIDLQ